MTKLIIGKGLEFGGLYILDHAVLRLVACSGITTLFEMHCRLGHLSPLVKKVVYTVFNFVVIRL